MRILAVGAHPDDLEILCGGTLAKYAGTGHKVVMAYVTDGSAGHAIIPPEELKVIRHKECNNAAKTINAEVIWLGIRDEFVFIDEPTRYKFIDMIRQAKPDLIITHYPDDYHLDHRATSREVFNASFISGLKNVKTDFPPFPKVPPIYYMDTLAGVGFIPEEYVDVSKFMKAKLKMLSQHKSQVKWLQDHDNINILKFVQTCAEYRGLQCNKLFSEGFRKASYWPRLYTERLLP